MYNLDFLTDSPKIFIFQKDKNKTNFGGILFLIYIIVMILISLVYLADYSMNEKYSYESLTIHNGTKITDNLFGDEKELNPILNISINFFEEDKFALFEFSSGNILEDLPRYYFSKRYNDSDIIIFYKCGKDQTCASFKEYIRNVQYSDIFGHLDIIYQGYKVDHLHEPPVYEDDSGNYSKDLKIKSQVKYIYTEMTFEWEVIKYKEQKSLFDSITKRKTEFVFGQIKDLKFMKENNTEYDDYVSKVMGKRSESKDEYFYYLPIFRFQFPTPNENYLLYKRTKISFLDVIAKVGALFSTIKFFFAFGYSFYSRNFNNYAIVNDLLNHSKKVIKPLELSYKNSNNKNISINDLDNDSPLIEEKSDKNQNNKNDANINDNDNNNEKYSNEDDDEPFSFALNKLFFFDYFFNYIYFKCCKRMRNQEIINMTNKIAFKYLSIDSLLFNQMKLENLFKDYKWNNLLLNNVKNNKMLDELKIL